MITSKLTSKGRTTIPRAVRRALHVEEGGELSYRMEGGRVIVTNARMPTGSHFATFSEWASDNDRHAYGEL